MCYLAQKNKNYTQLYTFRLFLDTQLGSKTKSHPLRLIIAVDWHTYVCTYVNN